MKDQKHMTGTSLLVAIRPLSIKRQGYQNRRNLKTFGSILLVALLWSHRGFCGDIHEAARSGDIAKVRALIKDNPGLVSSYDVTGDTPLHWAIVNDHKEVVELLLANKADVNARDNQGHGATVLQMAALYGRLDIVKLLLAHHVDVNARDNDNPPGGTALHFAAQNGYAEIVQLLVASKADVNATNFAGLTPLHLAAMGGHTPVVKLLLARKADVNAKDIRDRTPLHLSAVRTDADTDVAEVLLAQGAAVNAKDKEGQTPLKYADLSGNKKVAEFLRQHGGHE
jgi:ankyrin repeat protein